MGALAWLILIIVLGFIEASTLALVSVWFIVGSVAAMISSLLGASLGIQLLLFAVVSAVFLLITRPFVKKVLKVKKTSTNADRVIGEKAVVLEEINNIRASGQAKIFGQVWTARAYTDDLVIPEGNLVRIVDISGNKLIVKGIES